MPDSCCSLGCTNRRGEKPGLCFYRIPSAKENPERRRLWIRAIRRPSVPEGRKEWQPSKYTRLCSEHFITGAKSDDPLSPDWIPSVFSYAPATRKRKRKEGTKRCKQHSKLKIKKVEEIKKQDAVDVLLELASVPNAEDEQKCDRELCKQRLAVLQRECDALREENCRLKAIIKSGTFDKAF